MPLLEVLDNESGIGYLEGKTENHAPLVEDLVLPNKKDPEGSIHWGLVEKYLVNKVNKAYETGAFCIDVHEDELTLFPEENWSDVSPSLAVLFRLLDANTNSILLEHAGGSSAVNMLGRFAHADKAIHQIALDITATEQKNDPDILYAEIIHLPESRVGNILLHPAFREYEIPYLAKSSLSSEHQVQLSDLFVSLKNNKVVLRSKRLNKQIIPRLSTAHNYAYNALPVYHFLCELQNQNQRPGLSFSWGSLQFQYPFLPRVLYHNTILKQASWRLLRSDFEHLITATAVQLPELFQAFRKEWRLPRYIVLADGDNEMLVDLDNAMMVKTWLDTVKNRAAMELREFCYPENAAVTDAKNNTYCNQFVATIIKAQSSYAVPKQQQKKDSPSVTVDFSIGSEWLYYKFYCGLKSADKILSEAIHPAVIELLHQQKIDQFFFIRYYDPGFHIRLRLHMPNPSVIGEVIGTLSRYTNEYERLGYIYKTGTDTYKRELDRYGHRTIELAEQFFYYDSEAVLQMLQHTWGDGREQIRWIWTLRSIDELLNGFGFSVHEKLHQLEMMKQSFAAEFKSDKMLDTQLNNKYRKYRKQIEQMLDATQDETNHTQPILAVLKRRAEKLRPVIDEIKTRLQVSNPEVTLPELLSSYIHMLVNRSIASKPRVHELVLYDLLHQYYRSVVARGKQKVSKEKIVEAA
jgi:thiopeptide-type bacteriocin biosynthesis protein